jgi:hypothetical protein
MDWSDGYFVDLPYMHGYNPDISLARIRMACVLSGVTPPRPDASYLELGFGQGVSLNLHAACSTGDFWGTDFHPGQVANAAALARGAGNHIRLLNDSFEELASRNDVPQFDIIVLHGIWSWISAENRRHITEIILKNLSVGGIVYVSYNCSPGWSPMLPVRHLMALHAQHGGAGFTPSETIAQAVDFVRTIANSGSGYFDANGQLTQRLEKLKTMDLSYLGHEFLNRDWAIMPFSEVCELLSAAKVEFAGSARLIEHLDDVHMKPETLALLRGIPHPMLRQSVRDLLVNQRFRQDLFVKGTPKLSPIERRQECLDSKFVLMTRPEDLPTSIQTSVGELTPPKNLLYRIAKAFSVSMFAAVTLADLLKRESLRDADFKEVLSFLILLMNNGHVQIAQTPTETIARQCRNLNAFICERAKVSADINYLASPVLGSAVEANRFEQLLILAEFEGCRTIEDQATYVNRIFEANGERLFKGTQAVPADQRLSSFREMAEMLWRDRRDQLKALGVIHSEAASHTDLP